MGHLEAGYKLILINTFLPLIFNKSIFDYT